MKEEKSGTIDRLTISRAKILPWHKMTMVKANADREAEAPQRALAAQQVDLAWTKPTVTRLSKLGYHPLLGARPLRRVIQDKVEDQIADLLVEDGDFRMLQIDVMGDGEIVVQAQKATEE